MKSTHLLCVLFLANFVDSDKSGFFAIKAADQELVLTAQNDNVVLEASSNSTFQLWKLEPAGSNTYYIFNQGNGKVITDAQIVNGNLVKTAEKSGNDGQKWHLNPDGTITSVDGNRAIDVVRMLYGRQRVVFWSKNEKSYQKFELVSNDSDATRVKI